MQKKTLTPKWNESFEYHILKNEIFKKRLQITVWDHDLVGKNDFMGEVIISLDKIPSDELVTQWHDLGHSSAGSLKLRINFDQLKEQLDVNVEKAAELRFLHATHLPNPYVKLYIVPDKQKKTKKKTNSRNKTVNPDFNEQFSYNLKEISNYKDKTLEVTVVDDSIGKNHIFGKVEIPMSQIIKDKNIHKFYYLINDE